MITMAASATGRAMINTSMSLLFPIFPEKILGHSVTSVVPGGVVSGGAVDVFIGCVDVCVCPSSDTTLAVGEINNDWLTMDSMIILCGSFNDNVVKHVD